MFNLGSYNPVMHKNAGVRVREQIKRETNFTSEESGGLMKAGSEPRCACHLMDWSDCVSQSRVQEIISEA